MTHTELERLEGEAPRFQATLRCRPRYVDVRRCVACGECARVCPVSIEDPRCGPQARRAAIFLSYPQAVPMAYQIDPRRCLQLTQGTCGACARVCPADAVRFDDRERWLTVSVGSVVVATGFRPFEPPARNPWGFGVYDNVVQSVVWERMLSAAAAERRPVVRPSDGAPVRRVAFVQCVGSRDESARGHEYCSSVCCMTAVKEASMALECDPSMKVTVFYTDMRTAGKDFDRYFHAMQERGVQFLRYRVPRVDMAEDGHSLEIQVVTEDGRRAKHVFDLVVLSVGMEVPSGVRALCHRLGVQTDSHGFVETSSFEPVKTSRDGIYVCGTLAGPKDIAHAVLEGSAAAAAATVPLADVRNSLSRLRDFPEERSVADEAPRVGVFLCHCGSNIAGVVDVEAVAEMASRLPYVVHVERNLFACAQDSQERIRRSIESRRLNRIVVAACSPVTHEALFRETLKNAGLNEYLFEMANIRNQAAWVHGRDPRAATTKAADLVRMAVAKVSLQEPMPAVTVNVNPTVLVVGGGVAGMTTALGLADQGFPVHLVEKSSQLGGNARHLYRTWKGEDMAGFVEHLAAKVRSHPYISVYLKSEVVAAEGYVGNFRSTIQKGGATFSVDHGVTVLAVGGTAHKPNEYGYAESQRVLTALEFDKLHAVGDERITEAKSFVFIQCVGSREPQRPYCSRVCCTHAMQAAVELKEEDASREITILYRDVRTYGLRESLYRQAREKGVVFIRYDLEHKPAVRLGPNELYVHAMDPMLQRPLTLRADVIILATAIVPQSAVAELAGIYKLPVNADGFFQESHAKLRPVEFLTEGVFMAGLAHGPKPLDEVIVQAQAVVARAASILATRRRSLDAVKAHVVMENCDGCALCLDVCPYGAIDWESRSPKGRETHDSVRLPVINMALCKGCGICQATCPKDGIRVAGFSGRQVSRQLQTLLGSEQGWAAS
ncbi:heterodisulfide reductase subunit A [Desulfosoma caldarium]|uniref:Heterodisulfide reductase subunit A n=2 Tax=Desulfosoma caldarium TaxID=610254 RepID=A0A3N1VFM9_9BACT|nr:heterodisulfide reductase subunit A [Desulfosoma caldarium]